MGARGDQFATLESALQPLTEGPHSMHNSRSPWRCATPRATPASGHSGGNGSLVKNQTRGTFSARAYSIR